MHSNIGHHPAFGPSTSESYSGKEVLALDASDYSRTLENECVLLFHIVSFAAIFVMEVIHNRS
jgi:hypothetical protein